MGELSYKLHVPSSYMQSLWDLLDKAGEELGIRNFGIEAQNVLRMEKGDRGNRLIKPMARWGGV